MLGLVARLRSLKLSIPAQKRYNDCASQQVEDYKLVKKKKKKNVSQMHESNKLGKQCDLTGHTVCLTRRRKTERKRQSLEINAPGHSIPSVACQSSEKVLSRHFVDGRPPGQFVIA